MNIGQIFLLIWILCGIAAVLKYFQIEVQTVSDKQGNRYKNIYFEDFIVCTFLFAGGIATLIAMIVIARDNTPILKIKQRKKK